MYDNSIIYSSNYSADPSFFAKVLFSIDFSLQVHWKSCTSAIDRQIVNDRNLHMHDVQDSILRLNLIQNLLKSIADKVQNLPDNNKNNGGSGKNGKFNNGESLKNKDKEMVTNSNKNQSHWKIKESENFSKVFYKNQKQCPKTSDGQYICMKYFLQGFCDKLCTRSHNLSKEDEKRFDQFVTNCREGASKPDFWIWTVKFLFRPRFRIQR